MKKALLAAVCVAATTAGCATASASIHTTTDTARVQTIAKSAPNKLRVGQRIKAPKLGKDVKHYQWLRCHVNGKSCAKIAGATHRFYTIRDADIGHVLRVREVLQGDVVAVSAPTAVVGLPLPVNTALPTITDNGPGSLDAPLVGDTLTGSAGSWTNAVAFTYQWLDCDPSDTCTPIAGATTQDYTIQASDEGDTIEFQVTAYNYQPGS